MRGVLDDDEGVAGDGDVGLQLKHKGDDVYANLL